MSNEPIIIGGTKTGHVSWQRWLKYPGRFNGCLVPPDLSGLFGLAAVVPEPPLLDPAESDHELLKFSLIVFVNIARFKGFYPPVYTTERIKKMTNYKNSCTAVRYMTDEKIPPAQWILYSIEFWNRYVQPNITTLPPIRWTLSPNRLKDRSSQMFQFDPLVRGKIVTGQVFKSLAAKHKSMQSKLEADARDIQQAEEIADSFFPGDLWDKFITRSQEEATIAAAELKAAAEAGGFLWA